MGPVWEVAAGFMAVRRREMKVEQRAVHTEGSSSAPHLCSGCTHRGRASRLRQ